MTIKKAIINYITACAERIKPCKHDWELLDRAEWHASTNPQYRWRIYTFRCKYCCDDKQINTNHNI